MMVSLHLAGYGPVTFEFDEVTHPVFIRLPTGTYMRFEDALEDPRMLTALLRRVRRRLDQRLTEDGVGVTVQKRPREFAAYWWFVNQLEQALQRRSAVEEAETVMGLRDTQKATPVLLTESEMRRELAELGQIGVLHEDGYGLQRLSIDEARATYDLHD
ncbi:MAG: hypothetical protein AB7T32_01785 [Dehalococcoidia bacterium]